MVHTLRSRESWVKEGRVVRAAMDPYKIVKARPKWDRMTGTVTTDLPLPIFGHWQTDVYVAPEAKDGKVPRNAYGNVELFKPWMLPKGTVHIPVQGKGRTIIAHCCWHQKVFQPSTEKHGSLVCPKCVTF